MRRLAMGAAVIASASSCDECFSQVIDENLAAVVEGGWGCKEDSQMCNGMKKAAAGFFFCFFFLFCHCSGAGSIYHPELIAHERGASRGDAAPAAITIRNRSTSASRGRRAAAQRGQDLPKGWKSLSLPAR